MHRKNVYASNILETGGFFLLLTKKTVALNCKYIWFYVYYIKKNLRS